MWASLCPCVLTQVVADSDAEKVIAERAHSKTKGNASFHVSRVEREAVRLECEAVQHEYNLVQQTEKF